MELILTLGRERIYRTKDFILKLPDYRDYETKDGIKEIVSVYFDIERQSKDLAKVDKPIYEIIINNGYMDLKDCLKEHGNTYTTPIQFLKPNQKTCGIIIKAKTNDIEITRKMITLTYWVKSDSKGKHVTLLARQKDIKLKGLKDENF